MRLGMTHSQTTFILAVIHLAFIAMAILLSDVSDAYLLAGIIILAVLFSIFLDRLILRKLASKEPDENVFS
jgi:hypothetical protein